MVKSKGLPSPRPRPAPLTGEALLGVYERDLFMVSGRGIRLFDRDGIAYLDFAAGVAVNGLGYGDRRLARAIRLQSRQLVHASNLYFSEPAARLAQRLVALAFPSKVFFTNSGAEGVEAAIKFARRIGQPAGRFELIALEGSFHGRTLGALSLTAKARYREPFEPLLPGVRFVPPDLDALRAVVTEKTAAVFVEPIQGEGGVRVLGEEFLQGARALCTERGALLVLDEIQCGLGRTGKMFAFQHAGIVPDVLVLAKALGGGLPLGAALLREDLCPALLAGDHGSTFGGNPVACAAGLAVLDRLASKGFLDGVVKRSEQLRAGLLALQERRPGTIADVRGQGLMIGVEMVEDAKPVVDALRARKVLATRAGDRVLRLLPPLSIESKHVKQFLAALDASLG